MNKYIKFIETTNDYIKQEHLVSVNSIEHILFKEKKVKDYHNQIRIRFGTIWIIFAEIQW